MELLDLMINGAVGLFSGAAGVLATIWYQKRADKKNLVLSLIDHYLRIQADRAHAEAMFLACEEDRRCLCLFPDSSAAENVKEQANRDFNQLSQVADWYEIIATLYASDALDQVLFDTSGLRSQMIDFRSQLETIYRYLTNINSEHAGEIREYWPNLLAHR